MDVLQVLMSFPELELDSPTGYLSPRLEGRLLEGKGGHGVFAREPIDPGELLVVWGGEIVTAAQLALLPPRHRERLSMQVEEGLFLLTTHEGPADWVNHSCRPNAGLRGQIVLIAMRPIAAEEEVTFDYAMCDTYPYAEFACRCGAADCRGRVTCEDWRRPELQKGYRGFFAPHVQARIDASRIPS